MADAELCRMGRAIAKPIIVRWCDVIEIVIVPTLCVGMHPASLQRCVTQSVTGGIPTQSVGTII